MRPASRAASSAPGTRSPLPSMEAAVEKGGQVGEAPFSQGPSDSHPGKGLGGTGQLQGRPRSPRAAGDSPACWGQDARVLGKGWMEAAVSTLHCSSLDSVFLSPIYTLSVSGLSLCTEWLTFSGLASSQSSL